MGESPPFKCVSRLGHLKGLLFSAVILTSALLGCIYILAPLLPLMLFNHKVWRQLNDRLVGLWLVLPCGLIEVLFGTQVIVFGDRIEHDQPALIIMNHRTCLDWMFFWNAFIQMDCRLLISQKILLKGVLRYLPGAGWAMAANAFIFLARNLDKDRKHIEDMIEYYAASGSSYQLLLFPEGTDKDSRASERSRLYAQKKGLVNYSHVLHPKTTGFKIIINKMRQLNYIKYIYDVTVTYPESIVQSELELVLNGACPKRVHYMVKKIDIEELPDDDESLTKWLLNLWEDKERRLAKLYESDDPAKRCTHPNAKVFELSIFGRVLYMLLTCVWLFATFSWAYVFVTYPSQYLVVLITVSAFVGPEFFFGGFEKFALRIAHKNFNILQADERKRPKPKCIGASDANGHAGTKLV